MKKANGLVILTSVIVVMIAGAKKVNAQTNTFPATGNVGIGTISPTSKLDILPANGNALTIRPYGTAANSTGQLQFRELAANGVNYVGLRAPDALAANLIFRLPTVYGTSGQVLSTTGSGVLTWITASVGGGASTTLNNLTATSINQALLPNTNNTRDLGSSTRAWRNIYLSGKVGIGITSPVFKLDVKGGSINTDSVYRIGGSTVLSVTGIRNTFVGVGSGLYNTSGSNNTVSGYHSLYNNTTGSSNTANGNSALLSNTTGSSNTANGNSALLSNTTGTSNIAIGVNALYYNSTGYSNTAIGSSALFSNSSGILNTALGALTGVINGSNPGNFTALGYYAGYVGSNSNEMEIGNTSVSWIGGQSGFFNYSDKRIKDNIQSNVPGLSFINKLNPVTYNLNIHRQNEICGINDTNEWEGKYDIEKITQTGFLAQEVEQAAKENNYDFNGVRAPHGNGKLYSIQYASFVVPLVKAVQELDKTNEELKMQNAELKSEIELIKSVLSVEQQQKINTVTSEKTGKLFQNFPNPFNTQTEIKFRLPEEYSSAQLIITDANGKQIRTYDVQKSLSVIISASELSAGTYSYALIIDGVTVDSKQMILTK